MAITRLDSQWIRRSFLVRRDELDPQTDDFEKRFFSSAQLDYTDTKPGGSICLNPPPQFTRFADIRIKSTLTGEASKGRFYHESFTENSQIIHMRFGVEMHNSLTSFFTGFYSSSAASIARTGRAKTGIFYGAGKVAGFVVQLASWKLLAVHFLGAAVQFLDKVPHTRFYYSRPTMPIYWNAVTTIVNHLAVNRGVVPRVFGDATTQLDAGYTGAAAGPKMNEIMPTIFGPKGSIDVYAIANRAKRRERQRMKLLDQRLNQAKALGITDVTKIVREVINQALPHPGGAEPSLEDAMSRWFEAAKPKGDTDASASQNESLTDVFGDKPSGTDAKSSFISSLVKFGEAELDDGSSFVSLRVNTTGTVQNSFTNSVGESNLSSKINGMSADMRSKRFDFANGNLVGGAIGALFDAAKDAVTSFGAGVLDSVQMSGLATLAGNAFVDIPKYWQGSTATLPTSTYTIDLVSPYHNPISQVLNQDLILGVLLAGVMPKGTGPQSYTGPFLVELFDRGRCQTRLGMIDSLSITRGVGNVGWGQDGKALGITVTFTIVDMSSVLHMPMTENFSFLQGAAMAVGSAIDGDNGQVAAATLTGAAFTPDTAFSDLLAVYSGMSLNDQIYGSKNLKLNLTRQMAKYETWKSPAHIASFVGDTFPARMMSIFYRGTDRQ